MQPIVAQSNRRTGYSPVVGQPQVDPLLAWLFTAVLVEAPAVDQDEPELIRQAQQDLRKFTILYERYVQRVYRYLLVHTGNVADAEDLTSQTFMAAMENLEKYNGTRPFLAWLLGIAKNKRADFFRRQKPTDDLDSALNVPNPNQKDHDDLINDQIQIEMITRKLHTLAPDRAEALTLRLFGELSNREIARLMHKEETAVRMLIHRGLRDLQAQLSPTREEQV